MDVFAKLYEDRRERGLEAQAFSWREIGGYDDVLDFRVGKSIDADVTRQPAPQSTMAFSTPPFCQEAYASQNQHDPQQSVLGEGRVIVEGDRLGPGRD